MDTAKIKGLAKAFVAPLPYSCRVVAGGGCVQIVTDEPVCRLTITSEREILSFPFEMITKADHASILGGRLIQLSNLMRQARRLK
jgi:hypothetical protein